MRGRHEREIAYNDDPAHEHDTSPFWDILIEVLLFVPRLIWWVITVVVN